METGEPIKDTTPLIYTPKEKGVMPQYDVRADKWDIAQNAMDRVNKERIEYLKRRLPVKVHAEILSVCGFRRQSFLLKVRAFAIFDFNFSHNV